MSEVRLFFGADFILSEITDILFEVKAVLCFNFYAFGDVFRRNGIVQQNCIVSNRFELTRKKHPPEKQTPIEKASNKLIDLSIAVEIL